MSLEVEPLPSGNTDGVMVRGVTESLLDDRLLADQLRQLWIERGLIVFKCEPNRDLHVKLSRIFGPLEQHPVKNIRMEGYPELIELLARPGAGAIYEWQGVRRSSWIPWHTDLIYTASLNHGGILRGMTIPKQGGATGFMDKIKLYDSLPVELKQAIVGRDIIYKAHFDISRQKYALEGTIDVLQLNPRLEHMIAKEDEDFPRVLHPAVITQPETGRKLLNVSPLFAERVEGLPIDESHELLSSLAAHIRKEEFAYFHQWSHDDLVLWDNWRMLHSALGIDPSVERIMQRTTIAGDYAQGRYLTT